MIQKLTQVKTEGNSSRGNHGKAEAAHTGSRTSSDTQVPWHHVQGGLAEAGDDSTLPLNRDNGAPHLLGDLRMVDLPDQAGYQA